MARTTYTAGMDGRKITVQARDAIAKSSAELRLAGEYDHLPREHRARIRVDRTSDVKQERDAARRALDEWADREVAEARKTLAQRPVGTAAEESRRVSDELRISRMVTIAKEKGVARGTAQDYAERAFDLMTAGSLDEAELYARAAEELGGGRAGDAPTSQILADIAMDRDLADPVRAKALRAINDVDVVVTAFNRDVSAAVSGALQESARLAETLGDGHEAMQTRTEASQEGRFSKFSAADGARRFGGEYKEPLGVVHGLPEDRDPRGAPQPEGSHLGGTTVPTGGAS